MAHRGKQNFALENCEKMSKNKPESFLEEAMTRCILWSIIKKVEWFWTLYNEDYVKNKYCLDARVRKILFPDFMIMHVFHGTVGAKMKWLVNIMRRSFKSNSIEKLIFILRNFFILAMKNDENVNL